MCSVPAHPKVKPGCDSGIWRAWVLAWPGRGSSAQRRIARSCCAVLLESVVLALPWRWLGAPGSVVERQPMWLDLGRGGPKMQKPQQEVLVGTRGVPAGLSRAGGFAGSFSCFACAREDGFSSPFLFPLPLPASNTQVPPTPYNSPAFYLQRHFITPQKITPETPALRTLQSQLIICMWDRLCLYEIKVCLAATETAPS